MTVEHNTSSKEERIAALFRAINGPGDEGDWRQSALCAQTDPEQFFPAKGESTRPAKKVCQSCPVTQECLNEALANDARDGVWGGLSVRERRKLKRRAA